MAIGTPTSIGSASTATSGTTLPLTVSAAVAAGQFVVVSASCGAATTVTCTFSDSKGNTYATDVTSNGRANGLCYVGSAQITNALTTSDTITATFSNTVTAKLICAVQVSGIATSAAKDQTKIASGTVVGWSTGASAATTQADELVIAACGNDSAATETSTPAAGFTELFDFANTTAAELTVAYQIISATGAQTGSGTWTNSGSRGWNAALVTYKAAAGGATPVTVTPSPANVVFSAAAAAQAATAVTPAPSSTAFSATAAATAATSVTPAAANAEFTAAATVTTSAGVDLGSVTSTATFTAATTATATTAVAPSTPAVAFTTTTVATATTVLAPTAAAVFTATTQAIAPTTVTPSAASSVYGASAVVTTPGTPTASSRLPLIGVGT